MLPMTQLARPFMYLLPALLTLCATPAAAQHMAFEDVIRNLRNPDAKVRLSAVQLLREARYPEAVVPIAPLVNDPVNEVQLEAIAAELSFFLVEDVPARRRVALVVEKRTAGRAVAAFDAGPLAAWPRPAPPELVDALLKAIDDDHQRVRLEAIYTLGVIGRAPLAEEDAHRLIGALDHYDPAIRTAAARVIGRVGVASAGEALIRALNDSSPQVRFSAMRALGEIREPLAVQALTDQMEHYGKGEGAWSALDALARIAHPSSVPAFKSRLADRDPAVRRAAAEGLGRAGASSEIAALQMAANDESGAVRAATAFALVKLGERYTGRLIDLLGSDRTALQIQGYFLELGAPVAADLLSRIEDPDPAVRRRIVDVLGAIGSPATIAALTPVTQDRNRDVALAATRAIERIKMRS